MQVEGVRLLYAAVHGSARALRTSHRLALDHQTADVDAPDHSSYSDKGGASGGGASGDGGGGASGGGGDGGGREGAVR